MRALSLHVASPAQLSSAFRKKWLTNSQCFGYSLRCWLQILERRYGTVLLRSDVAPTYGFGVSVARVDEGALRDLSRWTEERGYYVRLNCIDSTLAGAEVTRIGVPRHLGLRQEDFTDVFSLKAECSEQPRSWRDALLFGNQVGTSEFKAAKPPYRLSHRLQSAVGSCHKRAEQCPRFEIHRRVHRRTLVCLLRTYY
jgi:hypothetical protein